MNVATLCTRSRPPHLWTSGDLFGRQQPTEFVAVIQLDAVAERIQTDGLLVVGAARKRHALGYLDVALELHQFEGGEDAAGLTLLASDVQLLFISLQILFLITVS